MCYFEKDEAFLTRKMPRLSQTVNYLSNSHLKKSLSWKKRISRCCLPEIFNEQG